MAPSDVTAQYRAATLALRARTVRDLAALWPTLDWRRLAEAFPAWFAAASTVIGRDRAVAVGLASAYMRRFATESGAPVPRIVLPDGLDAERLATALRVTTLVAIKRSTLAGKGAAEALADAFVQSSGAATRLVLDGGRELVTRTTVADPRAAGWARVTSGAACDFCAMLAGRGGVYTEATGGFASHDHCGCSAEPVYR